jgi:hypothetical protein
VISWGLIISLADIKLTGINMLDPIIATGENRREQCAIAPLHWEKVVFENVFELKLFLNNSGERLK